jgi:hypothetical protein
MEHVAAGAEDGAPRIAQGLLEVLGVPREKLS